MRSHKFRAKLCTSDSVNPKDPINVNIVAVPLEEENQSLINQILEIKARTIGSNFRDDDSLTEQCFVKWSRQGSTKGGNIFSRIVGPLLKKRISKVQISTRSESDVDTAQQTTMLVEFVEEMLRSKVCTTHRCSDGKLINPSSLKRETDGLQRM